jgi:hypothetical protein
VNKALGYNKYKENGVAEKIVIEGGGVEKKKSKVMRRKSRVE